MVATTSTSRQLLCLAFHYEMLFPKYQFVFETKIDKDFNATSFTYDGINYECSNEDMNTALKGVLNFFYHFTPNDNSTIIISGQTYKEYEEAYRSNIEPYRGTATAKHLALLMHTHCGLVLFTTPSGH